MELWLFLAAIFAVQVPGMRLYDIWHQPSNYWATVFLVPAGTHVTAQHTDCERLYTGRDFESIDFMSERIELEELALALDNLIKIAKT